MTEDEVIEEISSPIREAMSQILAHWHDMPMQSVVDKAAKQILHSPKLEEWFREKMLKEVEDILDIYDDTYVRIGNHVPYEVWTNFKEGK